MEKPYRLLRIVRAVEGTGGTAFLAGIRAVPEPDVVAALSERHIAVSGVRSRRRPFFLTPRIFGLRELLIREDINPLETAAAYDYVRFRAMMEGRRDLTPKEADVAALVMALHLEGCRSGGAAWQVARVRELASVRGLWPHAPLRELLKVANAVLAQLEMDRAEPSAFVLGQLDRRESDAQAARARGAFGLASTLYRDMYWSATRAGAWDRAVHARLGMAATCIVRAQYASAHIHIGAARRLVRLYDLRHLRGDVLHERFSLAIESGRTRKADRIAHAALHAYGPKHPHIPALAGDVGFFWREGGEYVRARQVFAALVAVGGDSPAIRLRWVANLLWSAGCSGDAESFASYHFEALALIDSPAAGDSAAFGYLGIAWGLYGLGRHETAAAAARCAIELAVERGEHRTRAQAELVLDRATRRRQATPHAVQRASPRRDALVAALVASLQQRAAAA